MLVALKTSYLIVRQHLPRLGKYSPDLTTFANLFCSDSPDSPTFANLFCSDSPDLPTFDKGHFWKKCDSPRHIRTSNERVTPIWGEWPLLNFYLIQILVWQEIVNYVFNVSNKTLYLTFFQKSIVNLLGNIHHFTKQNYRILRRI
jgi:hypothetical protein